MQSMRCVAGTQPYILLKKKKNASKAYTALELLKIAIKDMFVLSSHS